MNSHGDGEDNAVKTRPPVKSAAPMQARLNSADQRVFNFIKPNCLFKSALINAMLFSLSKNFL